MAKPSSKRTTRKPTQAPAAAPTSAPDPEPVQEEETVAVAQADEPTPETAEDPPATEQQAEGEASAEETAPEAPAGEGEAEVLGEPEAEADDTAQSPEAQVEPSATEEEAQAEPAAPAAPSAPSDTVRMGRLEGRLQRLSLADVLGLLGEGALEKVERLCAAPASIQDLQKRMRATDGRCAPVYFAVSEDRVVQLVDGTRSIAAAKTLGLDSIFVIFVRAEDAGDLNVWLINRANAPQASEDDDHYVRVMSHYED